MAINPFSKSGSAVVGSVGTALRSVVSTNPALKRLFQSAMQPVRRVGGGASQQVIADYRQASIQLPKYYKEPSLERTATIQIVNAIPGEGFGDGESVDNISNSQPMTGFLLKSVHEDFRERYQLVETFGDDFGVFFTGETPKVFNFRGVLVNDAYRMWKSMFVLAYTSSMRGSELARRRVKAVVTYDYITVEGYLFDLQCDTDSTNETEVPFGFNMLITKYEDFGPDEVGEIPQYGGQVGEQLHSASSSLLTGSIEQTVSGSLPGVQTSPFFAPLMQAVDRVVNKVMPQSSLALLSNGKYLASRLTSISDIDRLPSIINEAISVVAVNTRNSPATDGLLDIFSDSISGDFGEMTDAITGISGQFAGQSSPAVAVVSKFSDSLSNVSSVLIPKTLSLSSEAISSLGDKVTISEAKDMLGQTDSRGLVNVPLVQSLQAVLDGLRMGT